LALALASKAKSLALALEAKSLALALALRVVALTPSLVFAEKCLFKTSKIPVYGRFVLQILQPKLCAAL